MWKLALILLLTTLVALPAMAQLPVLTTLHSFAGPEGALPLATLSPGADGSFYGTAVAGGDGDGTVFRVKPDGTFSTVFTFNGANGSLPIGVLAPGPGGVFYGTTYGGGADDSGTVFRVTPGGGLTTLFEFPATGDFNANVGGAAPNAGVCIGRDGALYGATEAGGSHGYGVLFVLTPTGRFAVLHEFTGLDGAVPDGAYPEGALAQGPDGAFYGTTYNGGASDNGTVFRLAPNGRVTLLHAFTGTDGANPEAGLTLGTDGSFYGTTRFGGIASGGTCFRITPSGKFTLLHLFRDDGRGLRPQSGLSPGANGLLYGTTAYGGTGGRGTVFSLAPDGTVTPLYKFHPSADSTFPHGFRPFGGIAVGADGALYGSTFGGGAAGRTNGTLYRLALP